jgi:hypothetical protein
MATRVHSRVARTLVLCVSLASGVAGAQAGPLSPGLSLLAPIAVGPVNANRDIGIGATASLLYGLPGTPALGLRFEATGLAPATREDDQRFITGSSALFADFGPQVSVQFGRTHAYAMTAAGISRVWAWSQSPGGNTPGGPEISMETRTGGVNFAWSAGVGIIAPLSSGGSGSRIALDLSIRFYDLGGARYSTDPGDLIVTTNRRTTLVAPMIGLLWHY